MSDVLFGLKFGGPLKLVELKISNLRENFPLKITFLSIKEKHKNAVYRLIFKDSPRGEFIQVSLVVDI